MVLMVILVNKEIKVILAIVDLLAITLEILGLMVNVESMV
jgi:hypothetical protein